MDVVRLHQAGITYAVATLGTATTQEHLNKVFRLTSELIFCFDGDRAGLKAAWRALENALPLARDGRELKFMFLPEGHDPDTLIAAQGAQGFEEHLRNALPLSEYLVRELLLEVDLGHVDGRAKLAALAAPLFARMPDGVYRELLLDRLAAQIRMPAAKLKEHLGAAGRGPGGRAQREPPPVEPTRPTHSRMSAGRGSLLSQAIGLVLHHPSAARGVSGRSDLAGIDMPGVAVLTLLLEQAVSMDEPSTAMLLERWRDRPEHNRLTELAMAPAMALEPAAAVKELQMAIQKLLDSQGPGRRVNDLLRKAEEVGLNYDEKTELSSLLKAKGRPGGAA
jgi:DNA primase